MSALPLSGLGAAPRRVASSLAPLWRPVLAALALAATCSLLAMALLVRPTELAAMPAASNPEPTSTSTGTGVPDAATVFAGREVVPDEPAPSF